MLEQVRWFYPQHIYGRPGQSTFVAQMSCPVLHHTTTPLWNEEIKLRLPLNIHAQHHLLFSFVHVSCDLSKKRDANASYETPVGYAWLPLLNKGKINIDEQILPVAVTLPLGYLAIRPLGLGRGVSNTISCHFLHLSFPFRLLFSLYLCVNSLHSILYNIKLTWTPYIFLTLSPFSLNRIIPH